MRNNSSGDKITNKYNSSSWTICACLALCFVVDAVIALTLLCTGMSFTYAVFPLLSALLDALFFVIALNSSFRFKYALLWYLLYVLVYIAFCFATVAINMYGTTTAMSTGVAIAWGLMHLLALVVSVATYVYSARRHRDTGIVSIIAIALILCIMLGAVVAYGVVFFDNGYFGQGFEGKVRPLSFQYDDEDDSYWIVGVLNGKGDTLVIPETFNNRPVKYLDCNVFAQNGIKKVKFEGKVSYQLTNVTEMYAFDREMKVYAQKDYVDDVKTLFYTLADDHTISATYEYAFDFANRVVPYDLDKDEVYVTFSYTQQGYDILNGQVMPTWIGKKGDVFRASAYNKFEFLKHSNVNSDDDLEWNYKNCDGYVFDGLKADGTELDGKAINQNYNVAVKFEKIYKVFVGDDNDTMYNTPEDYKRSTINGLQAEFKYLVPSIADQFIANIPARSGFEVRWDYSNTEADNRHVMSSLKQVMETSKESLYIYPVWNMINPTLNVQTNAQGNTVMYGNGVTFTGSAVPANQEFELEYKWIRQHDLKTWNKLSAFTIDSIAFNEGGTYTFVVTCTSPSSSLSTTAQQDLELTVSKRKVNITWNDETLRQNQNTYTGYDQTIGVAYGENDLMSGDVVTLQLSSSQSYASIAGNTITLRNAGTYNMTLTLEGTAAYKYEIATGKTFTTTIAKYNTTAVWSLNGAPQSSGYTRTYDGSTSLLTVEVNGVGSDGKLDVNHTCQSNKLLVTNPQNAGTYIANVTLQQPQDLNNYNVSNSTFNFEILRATANVTWNKGSSYVYSGSAQHPTANVIGVNSTALDVRYTFTSGGSTVGSSTNAGTYVIYVHLTDSNDLNNYNEVNDSTEFTIDPATRTITWSNDSYVYVGSAQHPTATALGTGSEPLNFYYTFTSGGSYVESPINAGSYVVYANLSSSVDRNNFKIENDSKSYEIAKATATVSWINRTNYVYNGTAQHPTATVTGINSYYLQFGYSFTNTNGNSPVTSTINVGSYRVGLTLTNATEASNYTLPSNSTADYSIIPASVSVTWTNTSPTYNGQGQNPTAQASGLYGNDFLIVNVTAQSGSSLTNGQAVNVGTYLATASVGSNYQITSGQTQQFTISKRQVSFTLKIANDTFTGSRPAIGELNITYEIGREMLVSGHTARLSYHYSSDLPTDDGYLTVSATAQVFDGDVDVTSNYAFTYYTDKLIEVTQPTQQINTYSHSVIALATREEQYVL